jgi:hypothetical protein
MRIGFRPTESRDFTFTRDTTVLLKLADIPVVFPRVTTRDRNIGAEVIMAPWLKTPSREYTVISVDREFDPFEPVVMERDNLTLRTLPY